MIASHRWCTVALLLFLVLGGPLRADDMGGPDRALMSSSIEADIEVGVKVRVEQRTLEATGAGSPLDELEADVIQVLPHVAYAPLSWFQVFGEAGWAKADLDIEDDGDGDFAWGAGFTADLFDAVIAESPVVGRQKSLGLRVAASYRQVSSGFAAGDLEYDEISVVPMLRYIENRQGQREFRPYNPSGVTAEVGVAFSFIDGDFGDIEVEEAQDIGVALGTSFRSWNNWLVDLQGLIYSEGDFSLVGGITYLF